METTLKDQTLLHVQEYLRSGKTLEDLGAELGIKATAHAELPLVILNYHQIDSPKTHPIVRECRALVLNSEDWSLVARSFPRFFNWGEVTEEMALFDFSEFVAHSKEDGSLCVLYHFGGGWHGNTRGSFGLDDMQFMDFSWREAFLRAMGVAKWSDLDSVLDSSLTYVCEFVSPWNKVVRHYADPKMYLLTAYRGHDELTWAEVDSVSGPFVRPERYSFSGMDEIIAFLSERSDTDKTFEGVVIRDRENRRWKVKSPTYLALHRMRGEGDNLYNPKNLLPFVLSGEGDELLAYFPEVGGVFAEMKDRVDAAYEKLKSVWLETVHIESQKDFALSIQGKTPFTGLLFTLRKKYAGDQSEELLKQAWRESSDSILKVMFQGQSGPPERQFEFDGKDH